MFTTDEMVVFLELTYLPPCWIVFLQTRSPVETEKTQPEKHIVWNKFRLRILVKNRKCCQERRSAILTQNSDKTEIAVKLYAPFIWFYSEREVFLEHT